MATFKSTAGCICEYTVDSATKILSLRSNKRLQNEPNSTKVFVTMNECIAKVLPKMVKNANDFCMAFKNL